MAVTLNKTIATKASVSGFIARINDPLRKADAKLLVKLFQKASKQKPVIWGDAIIGYGSYHYKYASRREGDSCLTGFSPRSAHSTIYIVSGLKRYEHLLKKLGKYKITGGCLHIKRLSDIHLPTLEKLIADSVRDARRKYKV